MDKNQATGLIIIALLVLGYFQFFAPKPIPAEDQKPTQEVSDRQRPANAPDAIVIADSVSPLNDSTANAITVEKYGVFSKGAIGTQEDITLENDVIKVTFSNYGGVIKTVELKKFKTSEHTPLILLNEKNNSFSLKINSLNRNIDLYKLYYNGSVSKIGDTTVMSFSLYLSEHQVIKHIYKIPKTGYQIGYHVALEGLDNYLSKEPFAFQWDDNMMIQEKDIAMSRRNSTINYFTAKGEFDGINEGSMDAESETIAEEVKWIALKQRFFIAALIADQNFSNIKIGTSVPADSAHVKFAEAALTIPYQDITTGKGNYTYYFGPNDYHILKDVTEGFSKNLYLGWPPMIWVNKFVLIPLFDLLNNFIGNYGIIIIIMVLLIKLVLSPLSYKSYLSMAKMKVLKPELDEIKERNEKDPSKAQQEQMKLYSQVGVNPLSGCVPMLLQMPILFAMFYFFPQSIELRGEGFLWADDLSTYDSIIDLPFTIPFYGDHVSLFVLLMTMSTILYTWSNQQVSSVQGPMKTFSYLMPVIFMFVLNSYPAALSFYYFVSNITTFGQQALIRRFVDEDKIKVILEENRKKNVNKKKSSFQQRIEDAMKAGEKGKQTKGKKK